MIKVATAPEVYKLIRDFKSGKCVDCGCHYQGHMTADHRNSEKKLFGVTTLNCDKRTLEEVKAELAKCDLVCVWCHNEREKKRGRRGPLTIIAMRCHKCRRRGTHKCTKCFKRSRQTTCQACCDQKLEHNARPGRHGAS